MSKTGFRNRYSGLASASGLSIPVIGMMLGGYQANGAGTMIAWLSTLLIVGLVVRSVLVVVKKFDL